MQDESVGRESLCAALRVGQHVRAIGGWEGYVSEISETEACGQGRLVTCHPITLPATPQGGRAWKPITVTEDELDPTGAPAEPWRRPLIPGRRVRLSAHGARTRTDEGRLGKVVSSRWQSVRWVYMVRWDGYEHDSGEYGLRDLDPDRG